MKKYGIILSLLFCCQTITAQVLVGILFGDKLNSDKMAFGLVVSPGMADISPIEGKPKVVLDLGLYFSIRMGEKWVLQPEVYPKVGFGAKDIPVYSTGDPALDSIYKNGSIMRNIKAMTAIVATRYQLGKSLYAEAGIQANLVTQVKDVFKTSVLDNELKYYKVVKENFTALDMGLVLGLVYRFKPDIHSMSIGIRYYGGVTDIMKTAVSKQVYRSLLINVYIPIGSSKAMARAMQANKSTAK